MFTAADPTVCLITLQGFTAELGASGSFCPAHVTLPVKAYFFSLSDDNAPSPYLVKIIVKTAQKNLT